MPFLNTYIYGLIEAILNQEGFGISFAITPKEKAKMDSKAASLLFLASMCLFYSTSMAFDITKILSNYPEFANFNDFLNQTGLAQEINRRQTITVLAVDNGALDALSGRPVDVVKSILAAHVILEYYDQQKLANLNKKSSILTTLYQTTGIADDKQGFLNVTKTPDGIMFGSAVQGAPLTASLVKAVAAQPYTISVLQVSDIIEPPVIENAAAPKKAPAPSPPANAPAKPPAKAPAPPKDQGTATPPGIENAGAPKKAPALPSPAKAPAKSPAKAPAPPKDEEPATPPSEELSPVGSPVEALAPANGPAADAPISDAPVGSPAKAGESAADRPSSGAFSRSIHVGGLSAALGLVAGMLAV